MIERVLLDTGPLVAALDASEQHHAWAVDQLKNIVPPLITCEAVLTEASYLLRKNVAGIRQIREYLKSRVIQIDFSLVNHYVDVFALMLKYRNIPMSLADACLVSMIEMKSGSRVFTLDSDFEIYRQRNRRVIPTLTPES